MKQCGILENRNSRALIRENHYAVSRRNTGHSLDSIFQTGRDTEAVLAQIVDSAMELVGAKHGILLLSPEKGESRLEVKVVRNLTMKEAVQITAKINNEIITKLEQEKKSLIMFDSLAEEPFKNRLSVVTASVRSVICTPLMDQEELAGILYLDNNLAGGFFYEMDLKVLELIAHQVELVLENVRLNLMIKERIEARTQQLQLANQELVKKNKTLQSINQHLEEQVAAAEEVALSKGRRRVASELHDTIGHTMTLLLKFLEMMNVTYRDNPEKTGEIINKSIQLASDGFKELRRSISGLVPEEAVCHNLMDKLKQLFSTFQDTGVKIDFTVEGVFEERHCKGYDVIYRTCQESLTNAVRHGRAENVAVILKKDQKSMTLHIINDGVGCPKIRKGLGLRAMEQRIKSLRGNLKYGSAGEKGFLIQAEIPLQYL